MNDIKNTLLIIGGSVVVVLAIIFGLSRIGDVGKSVTSADQQELVNGARFIKENLSTSSGQVVVTVVTFADIQCPACKAAKEVLKTLETMSGVRYVVRHFPLPASLHKYSVISAKAVEAARVLGKGWEMMDLMFEKQSEWSDDPKPEKRFIEYARDLGLDEKKFEETMNSSEVSNFLQEDVLLANKLRLSGTPSVFVNGELTAVPFVMDKVKELLNK